MAKTLLELTVTINQNNSITANWKAVSGAVRYHVQLILRETKETTIYDEKNFKGTSYTSQSNLKANRAYKFIVIAYGEHYSLSSESKSLFIPDNTTLGIPQNVKASSTATSVSVSFDKVSSATSYDILFDNKVYNTTNNSKTFPSLKPQTTHTYAVRAKNSTKTGEYSSTQSIVTKAESLTKPAVPSNIKKTATETSVTISWGAVSGATGYDLLFSGTTYNVSTTWQKKPYGK